MMLENKLFDNNMLFIIPSWGDLLGYPTLGEYANQKVIKILSDFVVFLAGTECAVSTEKGIFYFLFGLGYHYLKFELKSGRYITDNRQLSGLVLSDFVYDHLAMPRNVSLEDDRDVIVGEKLIKVPIDLSFKSNTKRTFIKGTLMRNVFIPYKDIIMEFIETIKRQNSYELERNKFALLSTHWDYYNKILISSEMNYEMKAKYLKSTAGLNEISLGADNFMKNHFSRLELKQIKEKMDYLKKVYSNLDYDPMYLFSIVDNASKIFKSKTPNLNNNNNNNNNSTIPIKMPKESVLLSAENRMNSFIEWPLQFARKTKEQLEMSANQVKSKIYNANKSPIYDSSSIMEKSPNEKFELRTLKNQIVEKKRLPVVPEDNIDEILQFLIQIIEQDYEMRSIGEAFELARDNLKKTVLHLDFLWEMSKLANIYQKKEEGLGLSQKEKQELLIKVNGWIAMTRKSHITMIPKY